MLPKQTLPRVLEKKLDKNEAFKDIQAFSALEGEDGERILDHLCLKFKVFDTNRKRDMHEAGYDEGVRAVLTYIATMREDYKNVERRLQLRNE